MKTAVFSAASGLALALSAPAFAQDQPDGIEEDVFVYQTVEEEAAEELQREINDAFAIFGEMFAADPLTEEQQVRLPLASKMTDQVFPEGSFALVMEQSMEPMMNVMMGAATNDPRTELSSLSGIPVDDLAGIDDAAAQAALDVFDPQYAARNDRMSEIVIDMMRDLFDAIEPAYREALSRAFAIRFETGEIEELLVFFETPVGGKFAKESILVQYDPQMLGMMEAMGPAMGEMLPGLMERIAHMAEEFPAGRTFPDLSADDKRKLSQLLGKGEAELEALAPELEEETADEQDPIS